MTVTCAAMRHFRILLACISLGALGGCADSSDRTDAVSTAKATPSAAFAERSSKLHGKGKLEPIPPLATDRTDLKPVSDANSRRVFLRASAEPAAGGAPLHVTFVAEVGEQLENVRYRWDFGDGSGASGLSATHTYRSAGEYVATVTAVGAGVDEADEIDVTVEEEGFEVDIEADPDIGPAPLTTRFAALVDDEVGPATFRWDFGDGGLDSSNPTQHTFRKPGEYTVVVTATNTLGQIGRRDMTITVDE